MLHLRQRYFTVKALHLAVAIIEVNCRLKLLQNTPLF
jgi:hypothetical protein